MNVGPIWTRAGRAAVLVVTAAVLLATSVSYDEPLTLDAETTCGPAGRIRIEDPREGCGGDPTLDVIGGPKVGLPRYAEEVDAEEPHDFVLAGPVQLAGAVPALTVHRVCRVSAPWTGSARSPATATPPRRPAAGASPTCRRDPDHGGRTPPGDRARPRRGRR